MHESRKALVTVDQTERIRGQIDALVERVNQLYPGHPPKSNEKQINNNERLG